ncbi:MAG: XRE family transcriptional regulator [Caulobacter sp.]
MITNEKQYRSARAAVERIGAEIAELRNARDGVHPTLRRAQIAGLESQVAELEDGVQEYEHLQSGAVTTFEAEGLADLPDILIRARIARGMSQRDLGTFVGVAEQQIQRYEAERYRSASLERLSEITAALDITVKESAQLRTAPPTEMGPESAWSFPVTEMFKRGYFEDFGGSAAQARKEAAHLIPNFFRHAAYDWTQTALHRRSIRARGNVQLAALAAWEARVSILADRHPPQVTFHKDVISLEWLHALVRLSARDDGPFAAVEYLRASGVVLVVEPHLPGTLLDGAALQTASNYFVVAMTLRHDRLDNFWFTLLHELAHLRLHVGQGPYRAIFDAIESPGESLIEDEADELAMEALIPAAQWRTCVSRFTQTERAVRADAAKLGIHPAIVAGRIRREANDYTLLADLVGAGQVRQQLI